MKRCPYIGFLFIVIGSGLLHPGLAFLAIGVGLWLGWADKEIDPKDAASLPRPTFADLGAAFVTGAKEGQKHPEATPDILNRSADAYCKLWHLQTGPDGFHAFHGING